MNKKIINNAISAYFGIGILLLLPSKKENINNPYVKKHALTAAFIHFLMFINYLIFISFGLLANINFFNFYLNHILASIVFIGLFGCILYGVSKAHSGKEFNIKDIGYITKTKKIIELKDSNLNEQGVLTIILSLIPYIGFIIKGKFYNYKSQIIENNIKINLIITLIISIFFALGDDSLGFLFGLFYLIYIGFYSILLVTNKNIISLNLNKILTFEEIYLNFLSFYEYFRNYFINKKFISIKEIIDYKKNQIKQKDLEEKIFLSNKKTPFMNIFLSYIPYFNILTLIDINSKNKNHIINGLSITILSIILYIFKYNNYQIFLFILIFFGIGFHKRIEYKFPFLFDIYKIIAFFLTKVFFISKKIKNIQNEVKEVNFKIHE